MSARKKARKRFIEAEDIYRLRVMTAAAISPDEKKVVYTVEIVAENRRKYYSHLYLADVSSGETRQFTHGEVHDRSPVWSPDGKWIAFLSTRDKKTGIYLIPAEGGAERKIYEADGALTWISWSPKGDELIFQFRYNDSHDIKEEDKKKELPLYRHVTRLLYRMDGEGFLPKDRFHIWKVEINSGKAIQLTRGKYDDVQPSVSPDGKAVVFVSNRRRQPELHPLKDDLYMVPLAGGRTRKIPTPAGPKMGPSFSPDGRKIAYFAHTDPDDAWGVTCFHLWTVGASGRPAARDLIPRFDRQTYDQTIGDMGEGFGFAAPHWSEDGKRIYFSASDTGSTHVFYAPARGGLPTRITKKAGHVKSYSLNGRTRKLAAVISNLDSPGELFIMPAVYDGDRKARKYTESNKKLFRSIQMPNIKEIRFKGKDKFELQGWLVTPPNFRKNKKYPGILEIHGGPRAQYGYTFYHEMLYLASKGYVVFYTNPRGGGGQGETFAGAIIGDWGTIDYYDCMAAADYLAGLPYVKGKQMGVTGGSYGGYMTNWIIGQTDRFRAAVTQRSVVDLKSFVGTSDFGFDLKREFGGQPWTDPEIYERCSPLTYVRNVKTPLLIIHSEQDLRCSIEQAEQYFVTLKLMGKKVEMVRFPEEPHGLSRHGRPDRRVARLDWIGKWFDKYLK